MKSSKLSSPELFNNNYFNKILYSEKKPTPLSEEITKRQRILYGVRTKLEKIIINNEEFYSQFKQLNSQNKINMKEKNKNKRSLTSYEFIKKIYSRNININNDNKTQRTSFYGNNKSFLRKNKIKMNKSPLIIKIDNKTSNNKKMILNLTERKNKKINKAKSSNDFYENISSYNLKPCQSNITFTNYKTDYTEKNSFKNLSKNDISKLFNDISNSNKNKISKNKKYSSLILKINNIRGKKGNVNSNNIKKATNDFKIYFNQKLKSLNYKTQNSNKELQEIIDINNEDINNTKNLKMKKDIKLDKYLDIREVILSDDKDNNKEKESDKNYKIDLAKEKHIRMFNFLKMHNYRMSDIDAMNIIEQLIDKKQKEKLDINKMMKDYYKRKEENKLKNIHEIRKKVENNYNKLLKLEYNL